MKRVKISTDDGLGAVLLAEFRPQAGIAEYDMMISTLRRGDFSEQIASILRSLDEVRTLCGGARTMFGRWLLSDAANQRQSVPPTVDGRRLSVVEQPPLDGSKAVLWLWLVENAECDGESVRHGGYEHIWNAGLHVAGGDSAEQSRRLLECCDRRLTESGCRMADDCIRTWFFVQDVDNNYGGLVRARREYFERIGLDRSTHYIASTGIGGRNGEVGSTVTLDAYAVRGLQPEQIRFLAARDHLSPTADYGVTFERGTAVDYGDRRHIFISGTASIDHRGEVVHTGDVRGQVLRMTENIGALLAEGGAAMTDIMMSIVYLRDTGDAETVRRMLAELLPDIPMTITLAPVCRPAWLVEMECIAVVETVDPRFKKF